MFGFYNDTPYLGDSIKGSYDSMPTIASFLNKKIKNKAKYMYYHILCLGKERQKIYFDSAPFLSKSQSNDSL